MSPDENRATSPGDTSTNDTTAWWIAIGVLAVIAIVMFAWKMIAVNQAEDRLEEARAEWRQESREALEERTRSLLRLSAEPLGLAVRDAAMEENYGTVRSYLDRVAGIEGIRGAVFAVGDTIRASTDAAQAGRPLSSVVPADFGTGGEVRVVVTDDGVYHAAVPITGLNERIGSLVLIYAPPGEPVGAADGPASRDTTAAAAEE